MKKVISRIFGTFFDRFQRTIMYSLTFSDSTSSNPRRKSERIKRIVEVNYQEQTEKMISGKTAFCLHFLQFQIFAGMKNTISIIIFKIFKRTVNNL